MNDTCTRCQRPILFPPSDTIAGNPRHVVAAAVVHAYYGCDTGCCGHVAIALDCTGEEVARSGFESSHPYGDDPKTWAVSFANERFRGVPLDWERCEVSDE